MFACAADPMSAVAQLFPDPQGGWQQCWHGRCWAHWNSPQSRGSQVYREGVGWGLFVLLFWLWFEARLVLTHQWPDYYLQLFTESAPDFSPCGRNMTLFSAKDLCKHLWERRGTTCHEFTFKNWPGFPSAAPCAPVINPQAPNAATGSSLRVCWGLFSDDTVECYQLCYKPVSSERHSDEQAGKGAWAQGDTSALHWQNQWIPKCLCTSCALHLPPKLSYLLCPSCPARSATLPAAAGLITGAKTGPGSSRDSRNGKGTVDGVRRISGGWALH